MAQSVHCSVCASSQAHIIEAALTAGATPSDLGGQYGLPTVAIARHKRVCLGLGRSTSAGPRALSVQR